MSMVIISVGPVGRAKPSFVEVARVLIVSMDPPWKRIGVAGILNLRMPTTEDQWLALLGAAPRWHPPRCPTVLVSPHPDDETLGAGGLIAYQVRRGLPVTIIAVTDGEAAFPSLVGSLSAADSSPTAALAATRREEQESALRSLGPGRIEMVRLSLPDGAVADYEEGLTYALRAHVNGTSLLLAPWSSDAHPDHEACGRVAESIAQETGAMLASYFFWTWHRQNVSALADLNLKRFHLDPESYQRRANALTSYATQVTPFIGDPVLPEATLAPARRTFETFALSS